MSSAATMTAMTAMTDKMEDSVEKLAALEVEEDAYLEMGDADATREVRAQRVLLSSRLFHQGRISSGVVR